jgi:hypothetical protein
MEDAGTFASVLTRSSVRSLFMRLGETSTVEIDR